MIPLYPFNPAREIQVAVYSAGEVSIIYEGTPRIAWTCAAREVRRTARLVTGERLTARWSRVLGKAVYTCGLHQAMQVSQ